MPTYRRACKRGRERMSKSASIQLDMHADGTDELAKQARAQTTARSKIHAWRDTSGTDRCVRVCLHIHKPQVSSTKKQIYTQEHLKGQQWAPIASDLEHIERNVSIRET